MQLTLRTCSTIFLQTQMSTLPLAIRCSQLLEKGKKMYVIAIVSIFASILSFKFKPANSLNSCSAQQILKLR